MKGKHKRQSPPIKPKPVAPAEFWQGEGGRSYTERNRVDWSLRLPFWQHIVEATNAGSFLEVGCNAGWNLHCLKKLRPEAVMSGVDLNEDALREAVASGFDVEILAGHKVAEFFGAGACELSFTCGVLIHVPPEDLTATMCAIRDASSQYVLAVEYESDIAREIEYRGQMGLLWARPYGKLYEALGLSLVETGKPPAGCWPEDVTYWLLEKN